MARGQLKVYFILYYPDGKISVLDTRKLLNNHNFLWKPVTNKLDNLFLFKVINTDAMMPFKMFMMHIRMIFIWQSMGPGEIIISNPSYSFN